MLAPAHEAERLDGRGIGLRYPQQPLARLPLHSPAALDQRLTRLIDLEWPAVLDESSDAKRLPPDGCRRVTILVEPISNVDYGAHPRRIPHAADTCLESGIGAARPRRAGVDPIVTKSLTGHVTERMREHYSSVRLDEKKEALTNVVRLIHRSKEAKLSQSRKGGDEVLTDPLVS